MRLNSATLSWQLTLNGPLPSGRQQWEAGSQAPEPQPGVPPSVAGSPGWREKAGAQSGGLSPELEPTCARCLLHTALLGQGQGGTETCPHYLEPHLQGWGHSIPAPQRDKQRPVGLRVLLTQLGAPHPQPGQHPWPPPRPEHWASGPPCAAATVPLPWLGEKGPAPTRGPPGPGHPAAVPQAIHVRSGNGATGHSPSSVPGPL